MQPEKASSNATSKNEDGRVCRKWVLTAFNPPQELFGLAIRRIFL